MSFEAKSQSIATTRNEAYKVNSQIAQMPNHKRHISRGAMVNAAFLSSKAQALVSEMGIQQRDYRENGRSHQGGNCKLNMRKFSNESKQ